jgi:hypothetical protein
LKRGKRPRSGAGAVRRKSRTRVAPPEIFVESRADELTPRYARAHLRNRRGYVYLSWREGDRVRSFYLGKAPRKSPTRSGDQVPAVAGAGASSGIPSRRAKLKGSR